MLKYFTSYISDSQPVWLKMFDFLIMLVKNVENRILFHYICVECAAKTFLMYNSVP